MAALLVAAQPPLGGRHHRHQTTNKGRRYARRPGHAVGRPDTI